MQVAIRNIVDPAMRNKSFLECVVQAYEETLRPWHKLVLRSLFTAGFRLCGTREKFIETLRKECAVEGRQVSSDEVYKQLQDYLEVSMPVISGVTESFVQAGCDDPTRF